MSTNATGAVDDREEANKAAYVHDFPPSLDKIERKEYDICVIGAGPAGLMLCSALARFGGHKILLVDSRHEPTSAGRADGIQPRTLEVLKNMEPLGTELFNRSSASYERTFWDPTPDGKGIYRARRAQSFPYELEIEDGATLGLQQGMIEEAFLRDLDRNDLRVHRPYSFKSFSLPENVTDSTEGYPVTVELTKGPSTEGGNDGGEVVSINCKYLVGCDGGRSAVRQLLMDKHGVVMTGEYVDTLWGALDAVVSSDFPDLRKIAAIHSAK
jgi:2-polyprenyl-6-methoxyphenol hydroxylase-like FAD-dependent oxidoreductase